ncbi:PHB depolymerase family esterase [soil metagenome]
MGPGATGLRGLAALVAVAVVSAACGAGTDGESASTPSPGPAVRHGELDIDGTLRKYRMFVPTTLDRRQAVPLLVVLHGGDNSVENMVETTGFDQAASVGNFVVAYPEATGRAWNAGRCCGSAPERGVDDMGFLSRLVEVLGAEQPVDPDRVWMAGVSNGAMMAYRFACERAGQVDAIASVAGSVMVDDCRPSRPVSVLELRGSDDPLIPFEGGQPAVPELQGIIPYRSAREVAEQWAGLNGCTAGPDTSGDETVTTTAWDDCDVGSAVRLVRVEGGGHVWFAPGLGGGHEAIDATEVITEFFTGLSLAGLDRP